MVLSRTRSNTKRRLSGLKEKMVGVARGGRGRVSGSAGFAGGEGERAHGEDGRTTHRRTFNLVFRSPFSSTLSFSSILAQDATTLPTTAKSSPPSPSAVEERPKLRRMPTFLPGAHHPAHAHFDDEHIPSSSDFGTAYTLFLRTAVLPSLPTTSSSRRSSRASSTFSLPATVVSSTASSPSSSSSTRFTLFCDDDNCSCDDEPPSRWSIGESVEIDVDVGLNEDGEEDEEEESDDAESFVCRMASEVERWYRLEAWEGRGGRERTRRSGSGRSGKTRIAG